jgi:hypothetical protein
VKKAHWKWFGHAGHLCVSNYCKFHLCTQVGKYLISSVGDYRPHDNKRETIGAGPDAFYETYVFKVLKGTKCTDPECGCKMPEVDLSEIEGVRSATAGEAMKLHAKMCLKYARRG